VGSFLSVHEGPQRIGKQFNGHALRAGMVISNEPGFYKDDAYGIRCENLVVVKEAQLSHEDGPPMFQFEALTVVPFDTRLVDAGMLNKEETAWINDYHARVRDALQPHLGEQDRAWLEQTTRPLRPAVLSHLEKL
jgi:Xaa-Pro aminopeptidase